MPDLNSKGEWCSGIGGGGLFWEGGVIRPSDAGGANWLNDDEVMGQWTDGSPRLVAYNVRTGANRVLLPKPIIESQSNGRGDWAVVVPGEGVYDSFGRTFQNAGIALPKGMGPDGSYLLRPDRNKMGWDLLFPDGKRERVTEGDVYDATNYGGGRLTWKDRGGIKTRNLPAPLPPSSTLQFRYVEVGGRLFQAYQTDHYPIWVQERGSDTGYEINSRDAFRIDLKWPFLVYATREGEAPGEIVKKDLREITVRKLVYPGTEPVPETDYKSILRPIVDEVWDRRGERSRGDLLNEIAWRANGNSKNGPYGLSHKTGTSSSPQPRTGITVATDIIHVNTGGAEVDGRKGVIFDVFSDNGPMWKQADPHNKEKRVWVAPVEPLQEPQEDPGGDPGPSPGPTPENPLEGRVASLEATLVALQEDYRAFVVDLNEILQVIKAELVKLNSRKYKASADVGRSWGHSHQVTINVEEDR